MNNWLPRGRDLSPEELANQMRGANEQAAFFGLDRNAESTFFTRPRPPEPLLTRLRLWVIRKLGGDA